MDGESRGGGENNKPSTNPQRKIIYYYQVYALEGCVDIHMYRNDQKGMIEVSTEKARES